MLGLFGVLATVPATAATGPKMVRVGAHFFYVQEAFHPNGCGWGIGIVFGSAPGATSYLVTYWDGYYKQVESSTISVSQLKPATFAKNAKIWPKGPIAAGSHQLGVTGGTGSGDCGTGAGDPTEGGRFDKGAKAWAIFPANYKPKAGLSVSVITPDGGASIGDTVEVKVKVTALEAPLTGVSLGKGLQTSGGLAEIVKAPKVPAFSLGGGASRIVTYEVKALSPGAASMTASATGKSKKGTVSGDGSETLRIAKEALALTMATDPARVDLLVNDKGAVEPQDVTVIVRLTNTSSNKLESVSLQSINPEPVVQGEPLDQLALPRGSLPLDVGTIPAKSGVTKKFTLKVTGDGKYQLRALALYATTGSGTGRAAAVGGKFEAVVPPLYFTSEQQPDNIELRSGEPWIIGGKTWYINGKLKNESSYKHLCIGPMAPKVEANAAATGPVDIVQKNLRDIGGPFAGELGPGKDISLSMFVDTAAGGGTQSTVTLQPEAALIDPGTKCNQDTFKAATKLKPSEVTTAGDGPDFLVHVDVSVPPPAASSGIAFAGGAIFGVGKSLFVDTVKQVLDLVALAHSWASTEAEYERMYPLAPPYAAHIAISTAQALQVATDVYATYWHLATQQEKNNLYYQAGNVLYNISGEFFNDATGTVKDAAAPYMAELEKAYASGDDVQIGRLWGEAAGSAIQQVVIGIFLEKAGATILADSASIEERAAQAGQDWAKGDAAKAIQAEEHPLQTNGVDTPNPAGSADATIAKETVPAGTKLGLAEKQGVWGIDGASDAGLAAASKDCECLIGVRSRAPESVAKIENGSVWKHEELKPKNVDDIDVDWLGFPKSDLSEVHFRTYTPEQEAYVRQRVAASGLSADEQAAILARFETRIGETQYVSKIEGLSKRGQINVGFNYRDNGLDKMNTSALRKFDLQSAPIPAENGFPAGGDYFTPYQENPQYAKLAKSGGKLPDNCIEKLLSVLCTVTGDVDGVYVTALDGSALPADKMAKVYKALQAIGWQHPETLTWINKQGEFLFGAKSKILKGLEQGGQAMVEYAPDGVTRATYLNLSESSLVGPQNFHLRVVGGYHEATAAVAVK